MRNETEANRAMDLYADMVRRICFVHMKNHADVEDVFQEVFLKYILYDKQFYSDAHEKAWLIRVAVNACKDMLKSFFRRKTDFIEDAGQAYVYNFDQGEREVLDAVFRLPDKYRDVIYLFYYEGYSAVEIAGILKKKVNTVYTWLDRAKKMLKGQLGGEPDE